MRKVAATIPGGFEPNYVDVPWLFSIAITQLLNVRKNQMTETRIGYSTSQIALHWIIAALVLFQLFFGESMTTVVDAAEDGAAVSSADQALGSAHYWIGISTLALVLIRLLMRVVSGAPEPAESGPGWMRIAARGSHGLFYLLLLLTPIVGLLAFYIGDPWGDIHSLNKPVFVVLISVHAVAALFHQYWLRDGTLKRMLSPGR
ncbi:MULTISPECIES: cytochrome b [unclassified Mesorhizobium]|nr:MULTISPECIES: cytochrome b [unclassified Mesorhizobium]